MENGTKAEARPTEEKNYRISGHESFPCRYAWLPKAVRGLNDNPKLFSDDEAAMVTLGVGKNMVRSIRFWIQTTGVAAPGEAIADTLRGSVGSDVFEILKSDGTPIGTIISYGLHDGTPPPGAPLSLTSTNFAITGGTGAFLGARGQSGKGTLPQPVPTRIASVTEDPANRRLNRGATARFVLHVIPMSRPEVVVTTTGPAMFHADFSPVTAAKPATVGEVLIVKATGLGPTVPGVNPGQPFPTDAILQVNSPVAVTVNGQAAEVVTSIGWPGLVDTYRVDFRMPDGATAGTAAIQLSAAWIQGPAVNIPIQ